MQAEENCDLLISGGRHKGSLVLYSFCSFLGLHKDVKKLERRILHMDNLLTF